MHLLSVSKFIQCQSVPAAFKSLCSPAGASCRLKKCEQVCVHILNRHWNPSLRHDRCFNITTAQSIAMHVAIQINQICSNDSGLCSSRILSDIRPRYEELQNLNICLPVGNCHNNVVHYFNHLIAFHS